MELNLHDQIYMHKIYSLDFDYSLTCFETSELLSSGSPFSSHFNLLKMVRCMESKTTPVCLFTYCAMDHFEDTMMAKRGLPDDGNCDELKRFADWLTSDEHIFWVLYKIFRILQNLKEIPSNVMNTKSVLRIFIFRRETLVLDKHFILLYLNLAVIIPLVMHLNGSSSTIHISGL
jgi:hypothetical protein